MEGSGPGLWCSSSSPVFQLMSFNFQHCLSYTGVKHY
uniref:Uncharacterized protein n=1 Tax=Anguilla anguilla TaxID=7936 RepID=A0A0E9VSN3_ANGAN